MYSGKRLGIGVGVLVLLLPLAVHADPGWDVQRIVNQGDQQNGPIIHKNLIVWKDFRGPLATDIWGYDIRAGHEFPIVQDEGFQAPNALAGNMLLYTEFLDASDEWNIWLMNLRKGTKELIVGGVGSREAYDMDGSWIVYLEGPATGELHAYNVKNGHDIVIADDASRPRISKGLVVWYTSDGGGLSGVRGWDIKKKEAVELPRGDGVNRQLPDVHNGNIVWQEGEDGVGRVVLLDVKSGDMSIIKEVVGEELSYPTLTNRYLAWRQVKGLFREGEGQAYASLQNVWVKDLRSGEITQLTDDGEQQVSPSGVPSIYGKFITWFSWVSGNGDVFLAEYSKR